jgi:hypothetical protein
MKRWRFFVALVLSLSLVMVGVAAAADWYVVKHKSGAKAAIDYKPSPGSGWSVLSGPYKSKDEAARTSGFDASAKPGVALPARPK